MLVTWDTGVSVHAYESAIVVMANMANTGKTSTSEVVRWSSRKKWVVQAPAEPATGEMIFPGPPFPPKVPQNGGRAIFPPLPQKCQFCFTQEIKGNLNFAPKVFQTTKTNW